MKQIVFTKNAGIFDVEGEPDFEFGRLQWLDGDWKGGYVVRPVKGVDGLLAVMQHDIALYKYPQYRIVEAINPNMLLDIKPTCAGCGVIAGIDCQRACEYVFGAAPVTEALPIQFNDNHQFPLKIEVATDGKHFGKKTTKTFWFNSVRCAELALTEVGEVKVSDESFGNGMRLLAFIGGDEIVKTRRKKRAPNKSYLAKFASKKVSQTALPA